MIDQSHVLSLGEITPKDFLRTYWQKKPLLIRQAFAGFNGLLSPNELMQLACDQEAQSRLVIQKNKKWHLRQGPFTRSELTRLPQKNWTLLVQDVNHFLVSARELLTNFRFIPHVRLDDLMVSYAPRGGGVGPHFDSYDVFLLQGMGQRRWQISSQCDREIIADAPLRILTNFQPEQEWILEPGDMLYLPPQYAHNGIAEDDCMTYSIGFRAPSHHEIITQFLVYLQDHFDIKEGLYSDPDLQLQSHPSLISQAFYEKINAVLEKLKWNQKDIEDFIGIYFSEPKSHVFFDQPVRPLSERIFIRTAKENGLQINLKSRILSGNHTFYINGESFEVSSKTYEELLNLADDYELPHSFVANKESEKILYLWYVNGYLSIKTSSR